MTQTRILSPNKVMDKIVTTFVTSSLLLAFPLLISSVALANPVPVAQPLYPWKTESSADPKTKDFRHCLVKNVFDNATLLIIAENNEGVQRLAIHFTEDRMEQGVLVDLALQVDSGDVFPVEGMTTTPRILAINVPDMVIDQMRKGKTLFIRGPQDEIAYQLKGSDKAILSLRDCVASHKNPHAAQQALAAAKHDAEKSEALLGPSSIQDKPASTAKAAALPMPVAPAAKPGPQQAVTTPVSTTAKANTLTAPWNRFFALVSLTPDNGKVLDSKAVNLVPPLAQAWKSGAFDVGFRTSPPISHAALAKDAQAYLLGMKRACAGTFVAEASQPVTTSNGKIHWQIAETVCSRHGKDMVSATLFTTSATETVTLVIRGDMTQAADAIRKRNAFFDLLRQSD